MKNTEKLFTNRKKMELFSTWVADEDVYVQVDATASDVLIPESHKSDPMLTLKMSMAFNYQPVATENGIQVTLKFNGQYFDCSIPWERVWGLKANSGEQKIWKEDVPKEAAIKMAKEVFSQFGNKILSKAKAVKKVEPETPDEKKEVSKPKVSHLKRIK